MSTKQALMTTTDANHISTSDIPTLTGFEVKETCPSGTATRYVVKATDGNWQKYSGTAWADVATQELTAASVMSEGNTAAELNAIAAAGMTGFTGKAIDVAAALQTDGDTMPTIESFAVKGESGSKVTTKTTDTVAFDTTSDEGDPTDIISINVEKTEVDGGKVQVLASIKDATGTWSNYADIDTYITSPATKAAGIKFRVVQTVDSIGKSTSAVQSITIKHGMNSFTALAEGTCTCISKTYDFKNTMSRAHLMVEHPEVADTEVKAYVALRAKPNYVTSEVLGVGTGKSQTAKLAHTDGIASHDFVRYFDDTKQTADKYSFSPTDGKVTFTADEGVAVTCDYIYGWKSEVWTPMTHDKEFYETKTGLMNDQFDYVAGENDPSGSTGAFRVDITQLTGKEKDVTLGTGTGKLQVFQLPHHAKGETITVQPETATWRFKDNSDKLLITAKEGENIVVSYEWAARTNYLESMVCIFNE